MGGRRRVGWGRRGQKLRQEAVWNSRTEPGGRSGERRPRGDQFGSGFHEGVRDLRIC